MTHARSLLVAALLGLAALCPLPAQAQQKLEGYGRITLAPGWRYAPNDHFAGAAAAHGDAVVSKNRGGPAGEVVFGYSATDRIEAGIDLLVASDTLTLERTGRLSAISYGALVGARLQFGDWLDGFVPYLGLGLGPLLVYTASAELGDPTEQLTTAYAGALGATVRFNETVGLTFQYRFLFARGMVAADYGGINGGGHLATLGLTFYVPTPPTPDPLRR